MRPDVRKSGVCQVPPNAEPEPVRAPVLRVVLLRPRIGDYPASVAWNFPAPWIAAMI
jgi:hypothetical protein